MLTNGTDSIELANVQGAALNALPKGVFLYYEANIPDAWTLATLTISGHTNSSADYEAVDFDHVFFTAAVPEPTLVCLLAIWGPVLAFRRRRHEVSPRSSRRGIR